MHINFSYFKTNTYNEFGIVSDDEVRAVEDKVCSMIEVKTDNNKQVETFTGNEIVMLADGVKDRCSCTCFDEYHSELLTDKYIPIGNNQCVPLSKKDLRLNEISKYNDTLLVGITNAKIANSVCEQSYNEQIMPESKPAYEKLCLTQCRGMKRFFLI